MNARRLPLPAREVFERSITHLRAVARQHGYALALHGSLGRDVDLLAVPWVESAVSADALVEALRAGLADVLGAAYVIDKPTLKPHATPR
jgi:hypothetical protein